MVLTYYNPTSSNLRALSLLTDKERNDLIPQPLSIKEQQNETYKEKLLLLIFRIKNI
jgi:hypothetical protein